MIAYLRGKVILKQAPVVILDVNGVGYEVWVPMSTYYNLSSNNDVELYCYQHIREDINTLYGFDNLDQRKLFTALIKTNGVGPRLGLTVLSNYQVHEFISIINNNNLNALVRLPGVGKKTAERLLLELKDRLKKIFNSKDIESLMFISQSKKNSTDQENSIIAKEDELNKTDDNINAESTVMDAISALESLGYKYNEANKVVAKVLSRPELAKNRNFTSEDLIKAALQEFR